MEINTLLAKGFNLTGYLTDYPDCSNCLRCFRDCACDPGEYESATYQATQDMKGKSVL